MVENAREYAIFSTDLERRVTSWNSGAQRLIGYEEDDVIGQSADVIFTPEDRAAGVPNKKRARRLPMAVRPTNAGIYARTAAGFGAVA